MVIHACTHQRFCHEQTTWLWYGWSPKQKTTCMTVTYSFPNNQHSSIVKYCRNGACVLFLFWECRTTFTHQRTCDDPVLPTVSSVVSFSKKKKFNYSYLYLPLKKSDIRFYMLQHSVIIYFCDLQFQTHIITHTIYKTNDIYVWWHRISVLMMTPVSCSNV
jgi:hypothetical protein